MADVKIQLRNNGPYRVYGPVTLVDHEEKEFAIPEGQWVSLCRCGKSDKKPFCDGGHQRHEPVFEDSTAAS